MADDEQERPQSKTYTGKVVLWLVVAVLVTVLILQNSREVRVELYLWDVTVRLWMLLLGALLLGVFLGWFLSKLRRRRKAEPED